MTVALAELLGGQSHCLGEPAGEDNRHETAHVGSAEPTERHYSLLKKTNQQRYRNTNQICVDCGKTKRENREKRNSWRSRTFVEVSHLLAALLLFLCVAPVEASAMIFPHIQSALSFVLHNSVPLKRYDGNEADPICAHLCSWMQLLHIRREQKQLPSAPDAQSKRGHYSFSRGKPSLI